MIQQLPTDICWELSNFYIMFLYVHFLTEGRVQSLYLPWTSLTMKYPYFFFGHIPTTSPMVSWSSTCLSAWGVEEVRRSRWRWGVGRRWEGRKAEGREKGQKGGERGGGKGSWGRGEGKGVEMINEDIGNVSPIKEDWHSNSPTRKILQLGSKVAHYCQLLHNTPLSPSSHFLLHKLS